MNIPDEIDFLGEQIKSLRALVAKTQRIIAHLETRADDLRKERAAAWADERRKERDRSVRALPAKEGS